MQHHFDLVNQCNMSRNSMDQSSLSSSHSGLKNMRCQTLKCFQVLSQFKWFQYALTVNAEGQRIEIPFKPL